MLAPNDCLLVLVKYLEIYPCLPFPCIFERATPQAYSIEPKISSLTNYPTKRKRHFLVIGISSVLLFFVVRMLNGYGNFQYWKSYDSILSTLFSFFNPSKYPPSISYLLMTLGPGYKIQWNIYKVEN
ncbi:hypothetical protein N9K77_01685 [bacterium]|nr:hypothetical protein [bacterium]